MNTADEHNPEATSRPQIILGLAVSAVISIVAVYLFVAIPDLIPRGGIAMAQIDFQTLSPIFFPRLTFALLAGLGVTYFISNLNLLHKSTDGTLFKEPGVLRRVAILYAIAVAYPILLPWLGFMIPTIFLMGGISLFLGTRVWWQVLSFAFLTPIVIRFVFERLLAISLPHAAFSKIESAEEALMQLLASIFL